MNPTTTCTVDSLAGRCLRVLLVEDNPGDADLLRLRLDADLPGRTEVFWVDRLEDALERLSMGGVDVVLLDLSLPDSSGAATVSAVLDEFPSVPVVVLTGDRRDESGLEAVQAGAQDYLLKGEVSAPLLWRVLNHAIERQRARQQIRESEQFLHSSLDALSAGVAILDENGFCLLANRTWCELAGEEGSETQGGGADYLAFCDRSAADPADAARLVAGVRAVLAGEAERFDCEFACTVGGVERWLQIRLTRCLAVAGGRLAAVHEDVTELKMGQIQQARLTRVLRGVRNVNQLITKEGDRQRLIQLACETLADEMSYHSAWILLPGEDGEPSLVGAAGVPKAFLHTAQELAAARRPQCIARAAAQSDVVRLAASDPLCEGCPLCGTCHGLRFVSRLEHQGRVYGTMAVVAPHESWTADEEVELFAELVGDIAYALHKIEREDEHRAAEQAMEESERRYRALFENAPVGIFSTSMDGQALMANPALATMLGFESVEEAVAHYHDLAGQLYVDPARREEMLSLLNRQGYVRGFEYEARLRDGSRRWFRMDTRLVAEPDGSRHLEGFTTDITERRKALDELRARENLLNEIFEVLPVGLWLLAPDGTILRGNPAARRIWGDLPLVPKEEYGIFQAWHLPSRELIATEEWGALRTLRDKVTITNDMFEVAAFDGERRIVVASSAPVLDESGEVQAAVVANLDVTELQQAMAEIDRLHQVVEQSHDGILVTDADGVIQYVNPMFEAMTGYARETLVGAKPNLLRSGRHDEGFYADLWATISAGKIWRGRFVNRRRDGELYTEDATISPVIDDAGRIASYVAVKRDITERLQLEEEKERLEDEVERGRRLESIGRLAGGVAHDLNNLLSPILGYGELLMLDLVGDEESLDSVREIVRAGERARTLVAQLLAFSRRQLLEFRPVDLNAILGEFENLLRRTIREDVELRICPDPDLPLVRADAGQLEQVIMNLAVNAQDAMPEGGVLVLETGVLELSEAYAALHDNMRPGKYVQLSVSDTGCGMDEETRARIFEPFFTTKGQEHGTGLGLATVYGIVKQHGGDIWVYSEPGHGCTFKIYLPVDRGAGAMVAETEETSGPTGGNETILLAEDDRQVRGLASAVLEREGYTVLAACGGEHALRLVREHSGPIDILLTDVVMPDINGRVLYEKLAKACPDLKVIYMSGYTDNVIAHHGIIEDDVNFLQKPFNVKLLARQVRRVLDA